MHYMSPDTCKKKCDLKRAYIILSQLQGGLLNKVHNDYNISAMINYPLHISNAQLMCNNVDASK